MLQGYLGKFKKFRRFLGKEVWTLFCVSVLVGIALFLVESSFILVIQGFLRAIGLVQQGQLTLPEWYPTSAGVSVALLLAFGVCRGIAYMTRAYVTSITGQAFIRLQRSRTLEFGFLKADSVSSHQVVTVFTERVNQAGAVLQSISQMILVGTSTSLFLLMGLKLAPFELIIGIVVLSFFLFPLKAFTSKIKTAGDGLRIEWEEVSKLLIQGLRHHFLLKIYGLIDREVSKARTLLESYEGHYRSYYTAYSIKNYFPNVAGVFVICAITYFSLKYLHTPGITLVAFFYLFIRIAQGAGDINAALSEFRVYRSSFGEIFQWSENLNLEKYDFAKLSKPQKTSKLGDQISIHAQNINFGYSGYPALFTDLSFTVTKGEVLLITGESGVGKSTILMLVIGILKPLKGSVLVNGFVVDKVQSELFEKIAYVGPEPCLIAGTIKENLLFGHHDSASVTDAEMISALKQAQLADERFQLDYFINEQTPMSTGQKQRLSIARGILRKPQLLILDEATANLDGATEEKFTHSFETLLKETTTIIISHKASFDRIATKTLELKRMGRNR